MRSLNFVTTGLLVLLATVPAAAKPRVAPSTTFSAAEREALLSGDIVSRPMRFESGEGSYLGGLSYSLVHAPPEAVLSALSHVETLPQVLPRTKQARLVGMQGRIAQVELVQGSGSLEATYCVLLERTAGRPELRFWLDPSRPHGIADVFGFFRVEPFGNGRSLVTVAAALDLGSGLTSMLFGGAVQRTVLGAPRQIREYVEPRAFALLDAPGSSGL